MFNPKNMKFLMYVLVQIEEKSFDLWMTVGIKDFRWLITVNDLAHLKNYCYCY